MIENSDYFSQASERLTFRKLSESDEDSWAEFFENNDSLKFLGIGLGKDKNALARDWISIQIGRYEEQGLGQLGVIEKSSGGLIGTCGILPREIMGKEEYEIAYSLKPSFWGKGYGTEMAVQMKDFGFINNMSKRFISIIDKANLASIKVAKKNEMEVLYETTFLGMDVYVFGIERE